MTNNNNRKSRDDKSKSDRSTTGRKPGQTDSDKGRKFGAKDDSKRSSFGTNEKRDSKGGPAKDNYRPRSTRNTEEPSNFKKSFDKKDSKPWEKQDRPFSARGTSNSRDEKPGERRESKPWEKQDRPFSARGTSSSRDEKSGERRESKPWEKQDRPFSARGTSSSRDEKSAYRRESKPWEKKDRPYASREASSRDEKSGERRESKPWEKQDRPSTASRNRDENTTERKSYAKKDNYAKDGAESKFSDRQGNKFGDSRPFRKRDDADFKGKREDKGERVAPTLRGRKKTEKAEDHLIRLNRFIANSGICSRRKADELIEAGVVSVNGIPVTELGHKVDPDKDEVRYNGEMLKREKKTYVLLNKPKDYITTTDDPQERRTVMQLVEKASRERIYPVGRLDRNTTGLLLMTNDGDLADKLSHPRNGITKIYQVELSKNLSQGDFNKIQFGLELEDGLIKPDNLSYVTGGSKKEIGIQIHSGKNRIVRRIFEHLGYEVVKLDRVVFGNLTKKDLPRGKWRYLDEHELIQIKHLIK